MDDAGLRVILDVELKIGLKRKIQINNVMKSGVYKNKLDTRIFEKLK